MGTDLGQAVLIAVLTVVASLIVTESYQTTPWLANKLMRWSVHFRYTNNPERAMIREEELIGLLGEMPTLLKLPVAGGFFLRALAYHLITRITGKHRARAETHSMRVAKDTILLPTLFLLNCTTFSRYAELGQVAAEPWIILAWAYGLFALVPLFWRDRAPVTVFVSQCAFVIVAWPFMWLYTPIAGIPLAMYAVAVHRNAAISLLALLVCFMLSGAASVGVAFSAEVYKQFSTLVGTFVFLLAVSAGAWYAGRVSRTTRQHIRHLEERLERRGGTNS